MFVCLFVNLFVFLFIYLFVCLFVKFNAFHDEDIIFSKSGLVGCVGSLREGTSASSSEGNGIGELGRGTEWAADVEGEEEEEEEGAKLGQWGGIG